MIEIKNIKGSVTVAVLPEYSLDAVEHACTLKNLDCRRYDNFIVVFCPGKLRWSCFKRRYQQPAKTIHINVTGCRSIEAFERGVQEVFVFLEGLIEPQEHTVKIDNITAVSKLNQCFTPPLPLKSIKERLDAETHFQCRLNPEAFSALCVQTPDCTGLLYHSGTLVLMGTKSIVVSHQFVVQLSACLARSLEETMIL